MAVGMTFPDDATHELRDLTTHEVSLVDKPANKRPFLIVKSAGEDTGIRGSLVSAAKTLAALLGGDGEVSAGDAEKLGKDLLNIAGTSVTKAWKVGSARDLPIYDGSWDGPAAAARVFDWAGFGTDSPDSAKARRAFLVYDDEATGLKRGYKLPFADIVNGELMAVTGGLRAAASRLPQTDIPEDVMSRARSVLDAYFERMDSMEDEEMNKGDAADEVASILDEATKSAEPEEFDLVLLEATVDELRSELEQAALDHGVEKAELEAKLAFQEEEHTSTLAQVNADLEKANKQLEEYASTVKKAQTLHEALVAKKDAEIAELTKKLGEAQDALTKEQKLSKAAPQARRALSTLNHLAKGKKAAKPSQVIPEGETQTSGDPWDDGWSFN